MYINFSTRPRYLIYIYSLIIIHIVRIEWIINRKIKLNIFRYAKEITVEKKGIVKIKKTASCLSFFIIIINVSLLSYRLAFVASVHNRNLLAAF
eukprot:gene12554-8603_t